MAYVAYEFTGADFNSEQSERFNASIGREYYSSDCAVTPSAAECYVCNSRTLAGYIPIAMHRSVGISTITRRSWNQIRNSSTDIYLIWVPLRGSVTISQGSHSAIVEPGNMALSYSNEPLCIKTAPDETQEHLSMQIIAPAHLVAKALSEPKRLCGISFPAERGAALVSAELLRSLYNETEYMDRQTAQTLALSGIDALLNSINEQGVEHSRPTKIREVKLQRLLDYMELHYSNTALTTKKVAKACNISTRYLHYLLKSKGKRFYEYLWEARLNSACQQLKDPALAHRTIAEIAFSTGFKSSAHFSRAFRNQFQCSPREVRQGASVPEIDSGLAEACTPDALDALPRLEALPRRR